MTEPVALTRENFASYLANAKTPVLVDFWASWCGPCRMIAPYVEKIAKEYDGRIAVAKVNIDEEPDLAAAYQVMSIPTLMVFKNGVKTDRLVGANAQAHAAAAGRGALRTAVFILSGIVIKDHITASEASNARSGRCIR